jgi:hypothetical protein
MVPYIVLSIDYFSDYISELADRDMLITILLAKLTYSELYYIILIVVVVPLILFLFH